MLMNNCLVMKLRSSFFAAKIKLCRRGRSPHWNFTTIFGDPGLSRGVDCVIICLAILVELRVVTDGQTDGVTGGHGTYRASIMSRAKTYVKHVIRDMQVRS